ncbi:MAG: YwaF family protein [Clostridia bacterium]|nr:YwaF family protein [Clostridia bacterium]
MNFVKDFWGIGGYVREPEGYMSWQHLTFVSSLMVVMIAAAVILGCKNRKKAPERRNLALQVSAVLVLFFKLVEIVAPCFFNNDPMGWTTSLPLFLCDIQMITVPLAAFARGRMKEASLDFVAMFGMLGAIFGTYCAGQNYACYPVISYNNVLSGITHTISGFASLYIIIAGLSSMKRRNIWISFAIVMGFCVAAYIANIIIDYNYMFLMRGDGTPYDIVYNLVNGSKILYPILVVALFFAYIVVFYLMYYVLMKKASKTK